MSPEPGSLNPQQRRRDLERMSEGELDVLVIGGGVTGVGCALDAATRGLSVGLVEQRDLASSGSTLAGDAQAAPSYRLQATSYKLQAAGCKLQAASCKLQAASHKLHKLHKHHAASMTRRTLPSCKS